MLDPNTCRQARLSRDARFDGRFFIAVTTTGIYCRPICPATPPHEDNVRYFTSAVAAAEAGFRPCLRCRPESAPGSPAWRGTSTTLKRALQLIDDGALSDASLASLCERLGIGERYLRRLFQQHIGVSPKTYAQHRQCLLAKQLLHQTTLPITDIAFASGFRSVRRFNDAFQARIGLAPRELRRRKVDPGEPLRLTLSYRPPYAWHRLREFFATRAIPGLEWVGEHHYGRTLRWGRASGCFTAEHDAQKRAFHVSLELDDLSVLAPVVQRIRRLLDLDADSEHIERHLQHAVPALPLIEGLRLPGLWSPFEAGVRAILGQQVTLASARRLVSELVDNLGESLGDRQDDGPSVAMNNAAENQKRLFPTPEAIAASELDFLGMPGARRDTLRRFAAWYAAGEASPDPREWTSLKGIGPWSADYAALRGTSHPDIWLPGDAGVHRALPRLAGADPQQAAPWRSYLIIQLWSQNDDH